MVHCPACGRENPDDSVYCAYCGNPVERIDLRMVESFTTRERRQIRDEVTAGPMLERLPSKYWPIAALAVYIVSYVAVLVLYLNAIISMNFGQDGWTESYGDIATMYVVACLIQTLVFHGILGVGVYLMLDTRRVHIDREVRLVDGIIRYVHNVANAREMPLSLDPYRGIRFERDTLLDPPLVTSPAHTSSPLLWTAVMLIGPALGMLLTASIVLREHQGLLPVALLAMVGAVLLFIAFVYMMKQWANEMEVHDARWGTFASSISVALKRLGYDVGRLPGWRRLPDRSTSAYVAFSIFFSSLFIPIWIHYLIDDQNRHLRRQRAFEKAFLDLIEPGSRR